MSARTLQHTSASDSFSEGREFHSALENHHARREERHTSAGIRMQGEMSELGNLLEGRSNDRRTHPCPPVVHVWNARFGNCSSSHSATRVDKSIGLRGDPTLRTAHRCRRKWVVTLCASNLNTALRAILVTSVQRVCAVSTRPTTSPSGHIPSNHQTERSDEEQKSSADHAEHANNLEPTDHEQLTRKSGPAVIHADCLQLRVRHHA
jgi:hypothetical protein